MVVVESGKNWEGEPCTFYLDDRLKVALDEVKQVVGTASEKGRDWDYVALICGYPGTGKSNFAQNLAKYCCPWFDESYIVFNADEFIEVTNNCKNNSAIVLDESFATFNSRVSKSSDFIKVVNHLQLLRQKNLYLFLCLPNFFDLSKAIAIYRSHHLFVTYSPKFGERGSFAVWDKDGKKLLYIKGQKYMDYNAEKPNFRGRFIKSKAVDEPKYQEIKLKHLMEQEESPSADSKTMKSRDNFVIWLIENTTLSKEQIGEIGGLTARTIFNIQKKHKQGGTK